jgi:hypothetical protein
MIALLLATPAHAGVARSWAVAMQATPPADSPGAPPSIADATVRQIVRLSAGGTRLRVALDNSDSATSLAIKHVTVAMVDAKGAIVPGTMRNIAFGGRAGVDIPAHAPMISDWLAMPVKPLSRIAVSIHVAEGQPLGAFHSFGAAKTQIAPGDQTDKPELSAAPRLNGALSWRASMWGPSPPCAPSSPLAIPSPTACARPPIPICAGPTNSRPVYSKRAGPGWVSPMSAFRATSCC